MNIDPARPGRGGSLKLLLVLGAVLPFALLALYAVQSHRAAMAAAAEESGRRAALVAEYTARVLDGHGLLIDLVEQRLTGMAPGALSSGVLDGLLNRHRPVQGLTVALVVMNPAGLVVANTLDPRLQGRDFGDRDYFIRATGSTGTVVGKQVVGRVTNDSFFTLSRRYSGGVIVVAIYARAFEEMFGAVVGADSATRAVGVFREDGSQLARHPSLAKPLRLTSDDPGLMQLIPQQASGTYRIRPKTGGGERLYAFQKVGLYPVWVTYGIEIAAIRAGWWKDVAGAGVLALLSALLLAVLGARALRSDRLARVQEERLKRLVAERTNEAERRAAEAERAHRAKSLFLAAASHDLRQPIQGLRLALDVLDQNLTKPAHRRPLGLATRALEGVEDLLSALLGIAVLETGRVRVEARPVALPPLLDGLAGEFAGAAAAAGIRLRIKSCSAEVETDPVLLARVLRNLLVNALRYTGQGRVVLGCRRVGTTIRIEVWDSGPGIPADQLDSVFEDFVQLGNPERDRTKGLGLGLSEVRRTAALLNHAIGVRSWPGRGSVFWIVVPCAVSSLNTTCAPPPGPILAPINKPREAMMKISMVLTAILAALAVPAAAADVEALKQEAAGIVKEFGGALKGELEKGVQAGGPLEAIAVCNEKAPGIAKAHAAKSGWSVGRTSLKLRNPGNKPDAWEAKVLADFDARRAAGESPDTLVAAATVDGSFRFMKAIPTAELCLNCHGRDVKPEVMARIEKLYPADLARGYKPGDIRGAFTLAKKL
ncbi:ATP-binding protein [Magnetospirillum sp. UT-4]|uniref:ATP-binding protein n=1 Tax=Magnetospirillum sp. UT-4 TaxID=2681467 RepID=UPI0015742E6D|nr:ATP-binding protein [Magnetospirillum sp. UT-4]